MSHIEPSWGFADSPETPEPLEQQAEEACHPSIELILPVAMGSRVRKRWGEVRAKSFQNKGTVHVHDRTVTLQTSVARMCRSPSHNELIFQREDIYNVCIANGRFVQFDHPVNGPDELETIVVRTRNREEAKALIGALPAQLTGAYATENRERLLFLERINARTPYVWATWTIVSIAVLVYFEMAVSSLGSSLLDVSVSAGSNFGPYTQEGQWWRLLTSVFIHAGFWHLFFNMLVLVQSGRIAERLFGTARFTAIYLFAGVTGSIASLLWQPGVNSMGASGAIYGVLSAIVAYLLRNGSVLPRAVYLRHMRLAAVYIIYTLPAGFSHHGIDNGAHVGGLLGGFVLGLLLVPSPDESTSTRDQRAMTLGIVAALACGLIGGMILALGDLAKRPERQEAIQFYRTIYQLVSLERRAITDVNALKRYPASSAGRIVAAAQIHRELVPEWQRLYDSTDAAIVPLDSADWKRRQSLLTYYGNTVKLLDLTANTIDANNLDDNMSKILIPTLLQNLNRERADVKKRNATL